MGLGSQRQTTMDSVRSRILSVMVMYVGLHCTLCTATRREKGKKAYSLSGMKV